MNLGSKVALVTGGSRGIGRAICIELASAGAIVVVNYAGNEQAATEVVQEIKGNGGEAVALKADVKDQEQVVDLIKKIVDLYGGVHILINNAGITRDNLLMRMKDQDWKEVIDTNLTGVYNCTKAVNRLMLKQKYGRIVNITSVVGQIGNAGQANYSAAKAGIIGLTKSLAREFASRQIRVNAVAPGYVDTDMTEQLGKEMKNEIENKVPLARLGDPQDIAKAVKFLVSDESNYITGQVLNVDGGMVMQ